MKFIFHITEEQTWMAQSSSESYLPLNFPKEGFIHTSSKPQILGVYDRYYKKASKLILLVLDKERIESEIRDEASKHGTFPHIYGNINKDAVRTALVFSNKQELLKILEGF